jgi:hypothetical protein
MPNRALSVRPERPSGQAAGGAGTIESLLPAERHEAVAEIPEMWNLSVDKVRELFGRLRVWLRNNVMFVASP